MQTMRLIDQIARWQDLPDGIVLARLAQNGTGYKLANQKGRVLSMPRLVLTELDLMG